MDSFNPQLLYSYGKSPGNDWIGDWVGPRACQDVVAKRKNLCPCWKLNPSHPAHSIVR